jgi:hypothetical protein
MNKFPPDFDYDHVLMRMNGEETTEKERIEKAALEIVERMRKQIVDIFESAIKEKRRSVVFCIGATNVIAVPDDLDKLVKVYKDDYLAYSRSGFDFLVHGRVMEILGDELKRRFGGTMYCYHRVSGEYVPELIERNAQYHLTDRFNEMCSVCF